MEAPPQWVIGAGVDRGKVTVAANQIRCLLAHLEQQHEAALAAMAAENASLRCKLEAAAEECAELRAAAFKKQPQSHKLFRDEPSHLAASPEDVDVEDMRSVDRNSHSPSPTDVNADRNSQQGDAFTDRASDDANQGDSFSNTMSHRSNNLAAQFKRYRTLKNITADSSFHRPILDACWAHRGKALHKLAPSGLAFQQIVDALRHWRHTPSNFIEIAWRRVDEKRARCMLTPMSDVHLGWTILGSVVIIFDAWETPIILIDDQLSLESSVLSLLQWIVASYWTVDVLITFRTGVYQDGLLIWDASWIALNYIRTWLLFDLGLVTADWLLLILSASQGASAARIVRIAKFTKVLRFTRATRLLDILANHLPSSHIFRLGQALVGLLCLLWCVHVMACATVYVGDLGDGWSDGLEGNSGRAHAYLRGLLWSLSRMQGTVYIDPTTPQASLLNVAAMVLLLMLHTAFLTFMISLAQKPFTIRKSLSAQLQVLHEFKDRYRLSSISIANVRAVLLASDSAMWSARARESQLLEALPKDLRQDLCVQKWTRTLSHHALFLFMNTYFDGLFKDLMLKAVKEEYCWPQEVVFFPGQAAAGMFFVARGLLNYMLYAHLGSVCSLNLSAPARVGVHEWISEPALWTQWHHRGKLSTVSSSILFFLDAHKFQHTMALHRTAQWIACLYARQFVQKLGTQLISDRCEAPSLNALVDGEDLEEGDGGADEPNSPAVVDQLPFEPVLPSHIMPQVCRVCINLAQAIASRGLDENRPHHGFIIIVGDTDALQSCGRAGFNPFQGHDVRVVKASGEPDAEGLEILRRAAFHGDGAVIIHGTSGKVMAAGWFVNDISGGGAAGGARSRSARAVAKQAGGCYVIKASEDSHGELNLHLGENSTIFSGQLSLKAPFADFSKDTL